MNKWNVLVLQYFNQVDEMIKRSFKSKKDEKARSHQAKYSTPTATDKVHLVASNLKLSILHNYKNKNWLQFLFIVKAAILKQQISKFYPQILSTEDGFYIYDRLLTEINVIASFCALNLWIKF